MKTTAINRKNRPHDVSQRGAALVELTLVIPLLLLMTVITIDLGRAILHYNAITKSVRDAVRYLSMQQPGMRVEQARNLVVYGSTEASDNTLVPGLTLANVPASNINWQMVGPAPMINTVTVTVSGYCFRPLFSTIFNVNLGVVACGNGPGVPYGPITATMRAQS